MTAHPPPLFLRCRGLACSRWVLRSGVSRARSGKRTGARPERAARAARVVIGQRRHQRQRRQQRGSDRRGLRALERRVRTAAPVAGGSARARAAQGGSTRAAARWRGRGAAAAPRARPGAAAPPAAPAARRARPDAAAPPVARRHGGRGRARRRRRQRGGRHHGRGRARRHRRAPPAPAPAARGTDPVHAAEPLRQRIVHLVQLRAGHRARRQRLPHGLRLLRHRQRHHRHRREHRQHQPGGGHLLRGDPRQRTASTPRATAANASQITGQNGTRIIATVIDECPYGSDGGNTACQANAAGHLDLSKTAFDRLGYPVGNPSNTNWRYVPCPVTGNVKVRFKSGQQQRVLRRERHHADRVGDASTA